MTNAEPKPLGRYFPVTSHVRLTLRVTVDVHGEMGDGALCEAAIAALGKAIVDAGMTEEHPLRFGSYQIEPEKVAIYNTAPDPIPTCPGCGDPPCERLPFRSDAEGLVCRLGHHWISPL